MAVTILKIEPENIPASRLIGKKYANTPNWAQWWNEGWFSVLEGIGPSAANGDAYIGAVHIVNGMPEYWIGMLFPENSDIPAGFEHVDIDPLTFAACYLYGKENDSGFYTMDTHNMCLEELKSRGLVRKEDDWCFERYNCPRFTTPDENGYVILDYLIAVEPD